MTPFDPSVTIALRTIERSGHRPSFSLHKGLRGETVRIDADQGREIALLNLGKPPSLDVCCRDSDGAIRHAISARSFTRTIRAGPQSGDLHCLLRRNTLWVPKAISAPGTDAH